jgi:hypothetical protein
MEQDEFHILLNFFKVLGNESRLKIVGILADRDCTVSELAALLKLKEPTVSEHLAKLKELNLVTVRAEGNYRIYSFNPKALYGMNKELLSRERLASLVDDVADDSERKILQTFFEGNRLKAFPASEKKLVVILNWMLNQFEEGVRYTEKEVDAILTRYHEDYATLRREMVDRHMLARERGIYWRVPTASTKDAG